MDKKKILYIAGSVIAGILAIWGLCKFVGWLNRPRIPATTVAVCYVDCAQAYGNIIDVAEEIIDRLPESMQKMAEESLEEARKDIKENVICYKPRWACFMAGLDGKRGSDVHPAVVIRCSADSKNKDGKTVEDLIKAMGNKAEDKICGQTVYRIYMPTTALVCIVKDKYVIAALDAEESEYFKALVSLYAEGKGETSDSFSDIRDISGDTIARFETCNLESVAKIFGVEEDVVKFAKESKDKKLADEILAIGDIRIDINVSDDVLGTEVSAEAGSKDLACAVEGLFHVVKFANRIGCDIMIQGEFAKQFRKFSRNSGIRLDSLAASDDIPADFYEDLRDSIEIERDGTRVTITSEMDMDDVLDAVVPAITK